MARELSVIEEEIATKLVEMVREATENQDFHKVGTILTAIYCRAMLMVVPGVTEDGRDILTVIQDCRAIATFPDPRRHSADAIPTKGQAN